MHDLTCQPAFHLLGDQVQAYIEWTSVIVGIKISHG